MALNSVEKKFALAAIKEVRAEHAAWKRDMDDLRAEGYGPSHCFHGMSLWVEWDPICGYCEDSLSLHQMALERAHARYKEVEKKLRGYIDASVVFGDDLTAPLRAEVDRLIKRYSTPNV